MIRIMTPDDYDAVHACWMACAGMGLNTVDDSREGTTRYLTRNPHTCFVSECVLAICVPHCEQCFSAG